MSLVTQLLFRPAALGDAALAADLMTAAYPAFASDPVVTRYRWEHLRKGWSTGRHIAQVDGRPVAFLYWLHGPPEQDEKRHCEVGVSLDRPALDLDLLVTLWRWISDQAAAADSLILEAYAAEDEPEMLQALKNVGYERDRLEKVWELDLGARGAELMAEAGEAREKAEAGGYHLLTVGAWSAAQKFEGLHALDTRTRKDIPTTFPILPETFENFMERLSAPDRPHDRWWVAVRDDEPVAMSYLRFPPVRGSIWTGYTCCDIQHRGRGLARAVKLQSLAQAVELGVPYVYTDNDSENAPMLHINEELGYHSRPGFVGHLMRVSKSSNA
jgi:RimJ/RimL family protein N-acetyltransferase